MIFTKTQPARSLKQKRPLERAAQRPLEEEAGAEMRMVAERFSGEATLASGSGRGVGSLRLLSDESTSLEAEFEEADLGEERMYEAVFWEVVGVVVGLVGLGYVLRMSALVYSEVVQKQDET